MSGCHYSDLEQKKLNVKPPETRGLGRSIQIRNRYYYPRIPHDFEKFKVNDLETEKVGDKAHSESHARLTRDSGLHPTSKIHQSEPGQSRPHSSEVSSKRFKDHLACQFDIHRIIPIVKYTREHCRSSLTILTCLSYPD